MNNEMNNGTNNTNPGQVVDNNTNNQPAMVNNGQNVDNSQQTNNGQVMNMGNQSMNNQPMGMPTNNQQPMMNNQNFNGNLMPNPNQKSNKTLFIVIGVAILVVIAAVVLINVTSSNKSKGNTINDFDNNGSNNQGQVSNDDDDYDDDDYDDDDSYVSNSSITYKGFSIPKQKGYEYEIDYDALAIGNDTFATMVSIAYGDMANAEAIVNESIKEYQTEGYSATNAKSDSYNGKKAYTFEITSPKGINVIWYLMEADAGYLFYGLSANDKYIIDYKDVETTVSLLANAKYNGEYKLTSDEIKMIKPDNLFK